MSSKLLYDSSQAIMLLTCNLMRRAKNTMASGNLLLEHSSEIFLSRLGFRIRCREN